MTLSLLCVLAVLMVAIYVAILAWTWIAAGESEQDRKGREYTPKARSPTRTSREQKRGRGP